MSHRVLNFYIAKRFATTIAIIVAAVGLITLLQAYIEVLRAYSNEEDFTAALGAKLAVMRALARIDLMLPFAFLFGAVISLMALSRTSELFVVRASGVSAWSFLKGPITVAVLIGAFSTAVFNPIAVDLKQQASSLRAFLRGSAPPEQSHWFRQDGAGQQSIMNAGSASEDGMTLFGVTAFVLSPDGEFQEKIAAPSAEFAGDNWILSDATILSANAPRRTISRYELPTRLNAEELRRSLAEPSAISVWSLPGYIETARHTGADPDGFRVAFHSLLSRPLMLVAMVLVAATVSLRHARSGGTWRLGLIGATLGFLFYVATEIVGDLGGNGVIDPVLAAWLPPIVVMIFSTTVLLYQEDG